LNLQNAGILHPFTIVGAVTFYVPPATNSQLTLTPQPVVTTPSSPDQSQQEQDAAQALYEYDLLVGAFYAKGPVGDSEVFADGVENGTVTAATIDAAIAALTASSTTIPQTSNPLQIGNDVAGGTGLIDELFGFGADGADTVLGAIGGLF
jgi:hypothetical protein